ncbi:MAG: heat-inducible transcriptional repressor HrcA [Rhodospirillales bacterium]|nr:heat-inducible transcriptional repressor HrcA [Alphaproteobacteria bacterium]MCB1839006.1 heat-inducible transcriptional repressor HrcA [Alphaproteobacteria bacterium]MCB9976451.1 heat-inducible transcriptional repressor HrcA [Rhodospirillales bacterium]
MITELNERSREIFRFIVDTYLETGQPVGSRTISRTAGIALSPASIRNTMADLEELGLLYAPHTSAGRIPTQHGLRFYIDGLMEIGGLTANERKKIETSCAAAGNTLSEVLERATDLLSGLCSCASLVVAPKTSSTIKQIQFMPLEPRKILLIIVMESGLVENRIMDVPENIPAASLIAASNYLNNRLAGKTLSQTQKEVAEEIRQNRTQLDAITSDLVKRGIALPMTNIKTKSSGYMIVRGQSHLLEDVKALEDLHRARNLLGYLEEQEMMLSLLESMGNAEGVKIYIGTENKIFDQSGWSLIISPYKTTDQKIVGAIGVIGPTRLDYDRIIPMVDYTSQIIGRLLSEA